MADRQVDYAAIRRRAEAGMKREKRVGQIVLFVVNVVMFVIFTAIALGAVLSNPMLHDLVLNNLAQKNSPTTLAFILPIIGWFTGLILHGVALGLDTRLGERSLREKIIMREMHDAVMQMADEEGIEKPKRDQMVRLSDDGELVLDDRETRQRMESRED